MSELYKEKYLKYKNKYIQLKKQYGGNLFLSYPLCIYHAFDMKFTDITLKLSELKTQGFSHIQLSPIQKCRKNIGNVLLKKKKMEKEPEYKTWWLAYQPYNYDIGNFYGSEDEFKKLVTEANKKELKIIVDIVINHISAIEEYEYPIYDIILIITRDLLNESDTDLSFWDLYQVIKNNDNLLEKYISNNIKNYNNLITILILINKFYSDLFKPIDLLKDISNSNSDIYEMFTNKKILINDELNTDIIKKIKEIDIYIKNDFINNIKKIICRYLNIKNDMFIDQYFDILTIPYYCSDNVKNGHNCWLAQALPQLNQKNKFVRQNIMIFLDKLKDLNIKCLRIDAASHIEPKILKFYCDYFKKIHNNDKEIYIYSEVINPQGKENKYKLHDFVNITHITEYNLLNNLSDIFCFNCDINKLNILNLPSGDIGSVVFSTTHDLESINGQPPALQFGNYSDIIKKENYKIILITCYLLQRIYNVPLIFKTQINNELIQQCIKFRKFLKDNNCIREESYISNNVVFVSNKYKEKEKLIATFYMNISDKDISIDNIIIKSRNIHIKNH